MAANKVILEFMGQNADAIKAARDLKQAIESAGYSLDDLHKKGKKTSDEVGVGFDGMFKALGGGGAMVTAVWKSISDTLSKVDQQMAALISKNKGASEVSRNYGEAIGRLQVNIPNTSQEELRTLDQRLREMQSTSRIGEGGLARLTDAYTTIQSSASSAPFETKIEALRQTGKLLELSPTEDAQGVALGVAKIMEMGGGKISGNQALNSLRAQQTESLVTSPGPIARGIPTLAAAASAAEMSLPQMQGVAAYLTQAIGDTEGSETISALSGTVSKIMTRGTKISDKLGGQTEITGNWLQRLEQISQVFRSGQLDEEEVGKLLPDLTRSEKGKLAILDVLRKGTGVFGPKIRAIEAASSDASSWTDRDIETQGEVLGAQRAHQAARQREGEKEARQAGDANAAYETELRATFEQQLRRTGRGDQYVSKGMQAFDLARFAGMSVDFAADTGRKNSELSQMPVLGGIASRMYENDLKQLNVFSNDPRNPERRKASTSDSPSRTTDELVQELRWLREDFRLNGAPRRPLKDPSAR